MRMDIPDVPCRMNSSTVIVDGVLDELDSNTIGIYLSCPARPSILVMTVLAMFGGVDCCDVSHLTLMWNSLCVFTLVVLNDEQASVCAL